MSAFSLPSAGKSWKKYSVLSGLHAFWIACVRRLRSSTASHTGVSVMGPPVNAARFASHTHYTSSSAPRQLPSQAVAGCRHLVVLAVGSYKAAQLPTGHTLWPDDYIMHITRAWCANVRGVKELYGRAGLCV